MDISTLGNLINLFCQNTCQRLKSTETSARRNKGQLLLLEFEFFSLKWILSLTAKSIMSVFIDLVLV